MRWYDIVFGGSKAFQSTLAMLLGFIAYMGLESSLKALHFWELCIFLCATAGVYGFFRVKEYSVRNGNTNNGS